LEEKTLIKIKNRKKPTTSNKQPTNQQQTNQQQTTSNQQPATVN
jgi:hypothetical protein